MTTHLFHYLNKPGKPKFQEVSAPTVWEADKKFKDMGLGRAFKVRVVG